MINIRVLNRSKLTLLVFLIVTVSCNDDSEKVNSEKHSPLFLVNTAEVMPLKDFIKWTADLNNELVKNKKFSEINYNISYMPAPTLAYIELKGEDFTKEQFDKAKSNYASMSYFNLRIELPAGSGELLKYNVSNSNEYNDRLSYMSFKMQNDIYLVQGNDTLSPGLFHYERIFEVASYATVMFAFDNFKFDRQKELTIIYDDHLFKKGYIKCTYRSNQLIDFPNISGV
jgi:hypothetical protein